MQSHFKCILRNYYTSADLSLWITSRVKKLHVRLGTYRVPSDDAAESHTLVAWADAFPVRARADVSAPGDRDLISRRTVLDTYEMRVYPKRYHDILIRWYRVTQRYRVSYNNIARGRS